MTKSALQIARAAYQPKLPKALKGAVKAVEGAATQSVADQEAIKKLFPNTYGMPLIKFEAGEAVKLPAMNVGVILSGGQAPGGHNVISGLFDGIKALNADSKLYGFILGPGGLVDHNYMELTSDIIDEYRNTGGFDIIGASLRMGIYKNTDNLSSGGITAKINVETGVIESDGVSFDITLPDYKVHPVSNMKIQGFRVPYWKEVRQLCVNATSKYGDNKSIGWDVAIKQDGPILIEGNHDWGARVWQMPAGTGLKKILSKYI